MKSSAHNAAPSDIDHSSQHSDITESTGAGETTSVTSGRGLSAGFKMPEGISNALHDVGSVATERMKKLFGDAEELFGDVGELVAGYPCALESGILRQGRMFITNRFVCFYCNHFGAEKKVRIPYKQIQSVTKENTAMVIPNAIQITTARTAYMFRSFLQRDECFSIINSLWKNYKVIEASGGPLPPAHVSKAPTGPPREVIPIVPIKSVVKPPPPPEATPEVPVLKTVVVPTQPVQLEVNYAPTGKLGVAYDILVTRGPRWHIVHADFSTLKEMYDEVVSTNAEIITCGFPPVVRGVDNMKGFGKLTPDQCEERINMLNTFVRSVLSNYRYIMPLELRQEFSAFIKMPEPDLALIDVTIPEAELAAAGGVVSRDFITKALEAKAVATLAQLSPDKDPNLDPTVVFKKNSSDTLGAKAADAHSVSSASSEAEPKLFTSTTRTLGVGGRPIFETHIAITLDQVDPYLIAYDFKVYRKLYEDLRVRGIGYDTVANNEALMRSNPYLAKKTFPDPDDLVDSSSDDDDDDDDSDAASSSRHRPGSVSSSSHGGGAGGTSVGQKLKGVTKDVGELGKKSIQKIGQAGQKLGQAGHNVGQLLQTMVTTGRPARHGSFSEIDIDIRLKHPFPKKFHYKKLSSKDLDERCAVLDRWMRCMFESYYLFDGESKEVVDRFLGMDKLDGADIKTIQLLNIVEKLNHKGPIGDRAALLAKRRGKISEGGMGEEEDEDDGSSDSTGSSASAYSASSPSRRPPPGTASEARSTLNDSSVGVGTGASSSYHAASSVPPPKPPSASALGQQSPATAPAPAPSTSISPRPLENTLGAPATATTSSSSSGGTSNAGLSSPSRSTVPTPSQSNPADAAAVKRPDEVIKPEELKSIRFEDAPPPPPPNGCCVIS